MRALEFCACEGNMRKENSVELISGRAAIAVRVEGVRVEGEGHLKLDAGVKECVHDHVCSRARLFATACMCWNLRGAQAIVSAAWTLPMQLSEVSEGSKAVEKTSRKVRR